MSHRDLADAIGYWLAVEPIAAYLATVAGYDSLIPEHPGTSEINVTCLPPEGLPDCQASI
ncbi:MAG: hypothetical protein JOZ53_23535 [Planctomycetaceae bacterium]|nr:hypothetical protein [Planctomycetaceae bacterium]